MVGHHLAVAPNHDPVGVGADLHRPPRRLGRHRVAVAVELDQTGGLRSVLRARPISRAIVFTPLPRAKCSRRIFATVSNTNTPVSIRAPQAADPAIKASRTGGQFWTPISQLAVAACRASNPTVGKKVVKHR